MTNEQRSWVWNIWEEGRMIDAWTLNHFLSGVLLGAGVVFFDLPFWKGFGISILMVIAWEIFEVVRKIHEYPSNRATDIVVGVVGILAGISIFRGISGETFRLLFFLIAFVFIVLEIWGYLAFRRRVE